MARLRELRLVAREHHLTARLALGQAHAAVAELDGLVADNPLREGLWRLLALALYRTARQAEALDALRRARGSCTTSSGWTRPRAAPARRHRGLRARAATVLVTWGLAIAAAATAVSSRREVR